jgi:hypothetical protein
MRFVPAAAALALALSLPAAAGEPKTYGEGVGHATAVKVAELVAHPEKYVGQSVRVEGVIVDVCAMRGCWMDLAGETKAEKVRIKVNDGVMVFPKEAKGSQAVAEGVFTKIDMKPEDALAYAKHLAEERGETFDPAAAKSVPTVLYQIRGTGAVIK